MSSAADTQATVAAVQAALARVLGPAETPSFLCMCREFTGK